MFIYFLFHEQLLQPFASASHLSRCRCLLSCRCVVCFHLCHQPYGSSPCRVSIVFFFCFQLAAMAPPLRIQPLSCFCRYLLSRIVDFLLCIRPRIQPLPNFFSPNRIVLVAPFCVLSGILVCSPTIAPFAYCWHCTPTRTDEPNFVSVSECSVRYGSNGSISTYIRLSCLDFLLGRIFRSDCGRYFR